MATSTKSTVRCPLCLKTFLEPKLLEQCMHSLCRLCICTFVKPLLLTDQREHMIACPICKTPFPGPRSVALLEEWSEKLPSDIVLMKLIGANVPDKADNCEPCNVRGQPSQACSVCKECQERLCGECAELHGSFKGTRTHTLTVIDSSNSSTNGVDQLPRCTYHAQKEVEYYCKDHDELICSKCAVLRHRTCDIIEIETASETMLQNVSVTTIRSNFQTLRTDIKTANKTARNEYDSFQYQVRMALLDVEDKRKKVIASFDKYKAKIADITKTHLIHEHKMTIGDERISAGIDNALTLLDTAIKSGNCIQLYLRCKAMQRQIDGYRRHINDCKSRLKSTQLEYGFSTHVTPLINDCSAVGTFQISVSKSTSIDHFKISNPDIQKIHESIISPVCTDQTECVEEKTMVPTFPRDTIAATKDTARETRTLCDWGLTIELKLSNVHVKNTLTLEIVLPDGSKPFFGGAAYLNDDKVVLTDVKYHRLILLNRDLKFLFELKVEHRPRNITVVNKKQVAVGLGNARKVLIVNVGSKGMAISKCIYTNHLTKCVLGNNQRLFMSSYEGSVEQVWYLTCYDLKTDEEITIESIQGHEDGFHIAMMNINNQSYIIHSCRNDDTVKCHTEDGKEVFSYKLRGPGGVDVDRYGNIFVASYVRHKIIHLSPTGGLIKTLVAENLCKPFEVRMNTARDKILLTQFESSEIHVIGLSYQ